MSFHFPGGEFRHLQHAIIECVDFEVLRVVWPSQIGSSQMEDMQEYVYQDELGGNPLGISPIWCLRWLW
jgi:hypothetical protein